MRRDVQGSPSARSCHMKQGWLTILGMIYFHDSDAGRTFALSREGE